MVVLSCKDCWFMESAPENNIDYGLEALALILRFHGIAIDTRQIAHQFAGARIKIPEMLRCAKDLKLKARVVSANWAYLGKSQLPAIVEFRDDRFVIVGKLSDEGVLIHDPSVGRPQAIS